MKHKFLTLIIILVSVFPHHISAQNHIDKKSVTGSWLGKLDMGAISLRIVFNISLSENDSLTATLDSPDQGVKNIKVGRVTLEGKDIRIVAPMMLMEYSGTLTNDTLLEGTFKQAGREMALNMFKQNKPFALNRPQEPKPPFPYTSEDVQFMNEKGNFMLAGTLTIPEGEGPFPAAVLVTGSGSQNRNEEIMGHKPFLVIADHLSRNGIAVLRYDDRGVGGSKGNPLNATSADFATDAEAALKYLQTRDEIIPSSTGIIGHSEGGLIAPIVATWNPETAFIVSLAGMGVTGERITEMQSRMISEANGMDDAEIEKNIKTNHRLLAVLKKETDNQKAEDKMIALYRKILIKENTPEKEIEEAVNALKQSTPQASYTWFRYYLTTEPALFWRKVRCPVLALNGEKDLQVHADENLTAIRKALEKGGNKDVTTIKLPDLNHLFQHSKTGSVNEYGEIEETFSPEVLGIMTDWILGLD